MAIAFAYAYVCTVGSYRFANNSSSSAGIPNPIRFINIFLTYESSGCFSLARERAIEIYSVSLTFGRKIATHKTHWLNAIENWMRKYRKSREVNVSERINYWKGRLIYRKFSPHSTRKNVIFHWTRFMGKFWFSFIPHVVNIERWINQRPHKLRWKFFYHLVRAPAAVSHNAYYRACYRQNRMK